MRRDELNLPDPPANDRPGDRWMCGRAADQPPCARGPSPKGICPLADACRPQPTWNGRRNQIVLVALTVVAIAMFLAIEGPMAPAIFKPGELSSPHAQILSGTLNSDRCASCHPGAATSGDGFFRPQVEGHAGISQADRCLNCHHTSMDRQTAKLAHNMPLNLRTAIRVASVARPSDSSWHDLLPAADVDQENVACGVCHQEHQGAKGNLLNVSDSKCQSCHQDRFGSFATSHPSWNDWPYGRGGEIAFNHATHAGKHFPSSTVGSKVVAFECASCHAKTDDNELVRSTSYEVACARCHDQALRLEAAEGIELLALPTLPAEVARKIANWPQGATGFYDGKISPLAELLMRSDKPTADAVRQMPQRDFAQLGKGRISADEAGVTIAAAHRQLLAQIASDGQQVIIDRANQVGIARSTVSEFARSLPPQLIDDAQRRWFSDGRESSLEHAWRKKTLNPWKIRLVDFQGIAAPPPSLLIAQDHEDDLLLADDGHLGDDDLLGNDDLLGGDDDTNLVDSDPLNVEDNADALQRESTSSPPRPQRFDATAMLPVGGWYRDDLRFAIRYSGSGHGDPVLKSIVEMISQLSPGDPIRKGLLANRAVTACAACHRSATETTGAWNSQPRIGRLHDFTKFSHGPHLNVANLADCTHCHQVQDHLDTSDALDFGMTEVLDFSPIARESCAACHTPHAAGDGCVKCHRYHIHQDPQLLSPRISASNSPNSR